MAEPVKFKFDQDFDGGKKSRHEEEIAALKIDMEQSRTSAYQQGLDAGRAQALQDIESATLKAVEQLSAAASQLFDQHKKIEDTMTNETVQLAYTIASKLAPALMDQAPMHELEALIIDCLQTVRHEPRLVVRVSEDMLDPLTGRIEALKQSAGFDGNIVVVGEPSLTLRDCLLEWAEGGTTRRYGEIQKQVEMLVQKYVMALSTKDDTVPTETTPDNKAQAET